MRVFHLYHGLWGPGTSVPLVPWFVGTWYQCTTFSLVCGAWYECTICIIVCGYVVRVYHLYHGLWGPGSSVLFVPWHEYTTFTMVCGGLARVFHLYHGLWGPGTSVPLYTGLWGLVQETAQETKCKYETIRAVNYMWITQS